MASTKKSYIGSAMRKRGVLKNNDREILVGFFPANLKKLLMLELLSVKKIILKDRVSEELPQLLILQNLDIGLD